MSASARDSILSRIRHAANARVHDEERRAVAENRLASTPKGIIPARGQLDGESRIALFRAMAEKANASVSRIASHDQLPEAVADWLRANNFPAEIRMGEDPRLTGSGFDRTALTVRRGPSDGNDLNGLSHADGGIAETGTVYLTSGPANPTSLNFLPENHIVVVAAKDIVGDMEALWPTLRSRFGKGEMPRSVNFITGPSRSGDIEQTLLLGAHGPRALHIFVVG